MASRIMLSSAPARSSASEIPRHPSLLYVALDEVHNTVNESGKLFGSINMEDFMSNLWTVEENQALITGIPPTAESITLSRQFNSQRINSLSLSPSSSNKTVEDVWKDTQRKPTTYTAGRYGRHSQHQKSPATSGEITLEDFLGRAVAFREKVDANLHLTVAGKSASIYSAGATAANVVSNRLPPATDPLASPNIPSDWMSSEYPQSQAMLRQVEPTRVSAERGLSPSPLIVESKSSTMYDGFAGVADSIGMAQESLSNSLALSPVVSDYGGNGRKRYAPQTVFEKSMERRQKRMIKNRESAARSRARKQAYTIELEAEVAKLKEENARLKREQVQGSHLLYASVCIFSYA
ncbi:hypothetical protein KP509_07G046200 [Ceratopteris richardii]|uniref:BZIP domain-containing protein n=1 Tax=Ceratopteris richardii TaxID=49495 RepID=A0A8T2UGM4_CERRI|nr:hypothetical protein KP509_07G046200 [Ceratopteris richardii]